MSLPALSLCSNKLFIRTNIELLEKKDLKNKKQNSRILRLIQMI